MRAGVGLRVAVSCLCPGSSRRGGKQRRPTGRWDHQKDSVCVPKGMANVACPTGLRRATGPSRPRRHFFKIFYVR